MINKNATQMGIDTASAHNRPIWENGILYNGRYLYERSLLRAMPERAEIRDALLKTDSMLAKYPFVSLRENNKAYGSPSWDIGGAIVFLGNDLLSREFLRSYLQAKGVRITVLELYAGLLCAKLWNAIQTEDRALWEALAKNECARAVNNRSLSFGEISAETVSSLGLPGINRVD